MKVTVGGTLFLILHRLGIASSYPITTATLQTASAAEWRAHRRYVSYARVARTEEYDGIAYLFTALATSELIHAQNYNRLLVSYGEQTVEPGRPDVPADTTKANLIDAAEKEIRSIDIVYPDILRRVRIEAVDDAVLAVGYAWESHKQHRDIINKVRRWTPGHFEAVARRIHETTDRYYICQLCGSTLLEQPQADCPICRNSPRHYRQISPTLFG